MQPLRGQSTWDPKHREYADFTQQFVDLANRRDGLETWMRGNTKPFAVRDIPVRDKDFRQCNLSQFAFIGCTFENCHFDANGFSTTVFDDAKFLKCNFAGEIPQSRFGLCQFTECQFNNIYGTQFYDCRITATTFAQRIWQCDLFNTTFYNLNLSGVDFDKCNLAQVKLPDVLLDGSTKFRNSKSTGGMEVTRNQLAFLDPSDFGGLTPGQRQEMNIRDDVGQLRKSFGGYLRVIHLIALTAFVAPYVIFVAFHYLQTVVHPDAIKGITIRRALWNYVITGGENWETGNPVNWFAVNSAITFLGYNVLRIALIWKTMGLELHERITGLPAKFELLPFASLWPLKDDVWSYFYWFARVYFWIAMAASAMHVWNFLGIRIPIVSE